MRIESAFIPQPLVDGHKVTEKSEVNVEDAGNREWESETSYVPSPFGTCGIYSISSLRAAVDYQAKFLTVAENNIQAAEHPQSIPRVLIDQLVGRFS